jgi:hypothetical protein
MSRNDLEALPVPYEPPKQSAIGQIIDSVLLLGLVILSLFAPVYFGLADDKKLTLTFAGKSWQALGQNPTAQAQWEKLGFTPDTARDMIASRFDYSFQWPVFALTAAVIIIYFAFVIYFSNKEYRDVIDERFGPSIKGARR